MTYGTETSVVYSETELRFSTENHLVLGPKVS